MSILTFDEKAGFFLPFYGRTNVKWLELVKCSKWTVKVYISLEFLTELSDRLCLNFTLCNDVSFSFSCFLYGYIFFCAAFILNMFQMLQFFDIPKFTDCDFVTPRSSVCGSNRNILIEPKVINLLVLTNWKRSSARLCLLLVAWKDIPELVSFAI